MLGVLMFCTTKQAPVSGVYSGRQFVGMHLHRRRSVLVRMTESGEHLETVRIVNTDDRLADVMSRAGGVGGGSGGHVPSPHAADPTVD